MLLDPDPDPRLSDSCRSLLGLPPGDTTTSSFQRIFPVFLGCTSWLSIVTTANEVCAKLFSPTSARIAGSAAPTLDSVRINADLLFLRRSGITALVSASSAALRPHTVQPFSSPSLSAVVAARLHSLVSYDNRVLFHPQFVPNGGVGITPLPDALVPGVAIAALLAADQRLGRVIVLPHTEFVQACHQAGVPFNTTRAHLTAKPGNPLGRLVVPFPGINHQDKKPILMSRWGPLRDPQLADICQLLAHAHTVFPGGNIICAKRDVDSAYKRILHCPPDVPLLAIRFKVDAQDLVALPLCCHFGLQDSNFQFGVITDTLRQLSRARLLTQCPLQLSGMVTDDFVVFGPPALVHREVIDIGQDMRRLLSDTAVNLKKDEVGPVVTVAGFVFDCPRSIVALSQRHFCTLVHAFFSLMPVSPKPGDIVSLRDIQCIASMAIRAANVLTPLLPFSRGFYTCLEGVPCGVTTTRWTRVAVLDLHFWRTALQLSVHSVAWLTVPITHPLLYQLQIGETPSIRDQRQAATADYVVYSDAFQTGPASGIGVFLPHQVWMYMDTSSIGYFVDFEGVSVPIHINSLEFLAAVMAIVSTVRHLGPGAVRGLHIHLFSDNIAALSWLRQYRKRSPFHLRLLLLVSYMQIRYDFVLTGAFIPGVTNIWADAVSRNFAVPNGPALRQSLLSIPQMHPSPLGLQILQSIATGSYTTPSLLARETLIALDGLIGSTSAPLLV